MQKRLKKPTCKVLPQQKLLTASVLSLKVELGYNKTGTHLNPGLFRAS